MIHRLQTSVLSPRTWLTLVSLSVVLLIGQAASSQEATLDPPYPRIFAHRTGGWGSVDQTQLRIIARHNVANLGLWRTWSASGYNPTTLSAYIKSLNPKVKLLMTHPYVQTAFSDTGADVEIKAKVSSEKGKNGVGDWWLRNADGTNITGFSDSKWRINISDQVTPDTNGRRHGEWYFQWMYAKNSDGIDHVTKGVGMREGSWDGIYEDDQYISYGFGVNADYDEDGVQDSAWDEDVRTWVINGHRTYRNAMKAAEPNWIFLANMSSQLSPKETVPGSLQGTNDGGFFERMTFYETTQGWAEMMARYRRGLSWLTGPKIGVMHNDLNSFKTKYATSGFSDYRWNRYGLCSALMDDGYYAVTDNSYSVILWFDEQWGGSLQRVGYLGYPIDPPQTSAWSQGVYRREFDNGLVLVNPKGNGTRTINVGSGWKRILGQQDPVHNNGQAVTSITLDEQDGIILVRENVIERPMPPELSPVG